MVCWNNFKRVCRHIRVPIRAIFTRVGKHVSFTLNLSILSMSVSSFTLNWTYGLSEIYHSTWNVLTIEIQPWHIALALLPNGKDKNVCTGSLGHNFYQQQSADEIRLLTWLILFARSLLSSGKRISPGSQTGPGITMWQLNGSILGSGYVCDVNCASHSNAHNVRIAIRRKCEICRIPRSGDVYRLTYKKIMRIEGNQHLETTTFKLSIIIPITL